MDRIVALVPMRHTSERVPQKNYRLFSGKPLYHYIVKTLLSCPLISEIVINTDSQFITNDAREHFPNVRIIERPENLREGTTPMNEILLYDVTQVEADYFLQTHSTNPLLRPITISQAIKKFLNNFPTHDSLFSVTKCQSRFWDGLGQALNHNPALLLRTQDLLPIFEENSCIYMFTRKTLESEYNRIGRRPLMFEIDREEAMDIDEEIDFSLAELMYQKYRKSC